MRIAFISTLWGHPWGGSEELWYRAALAALDAGHEVFVLMAETSKGHPRVEELQRRGARLGFRKLYLPSRSPLSRASSIVRGKFARRFGFDFAELTKFRPERAMVNLSPTYAILSAPEIRNYLSSSGVPHGFICQGHADEPFSSDEWRSIVRDSFRRANWMGFVSEDNLKSAERHLATRLSHGFVVQNPSDLPSNEYLPFPSPLEPLRLLNVGRFEPIQKGQDLLFEALGTEAWSSRNWTLSLAGSNIHQRQYLDDASELYGIKDKIKLLGHVNDVQQVWREHHVLVLPSRYEGTPLALIEAMISGRTAMVTNVSGNCEWMDADIGFVAEAPSRPYVTAALERMWEQREELEELGKKCHQRASELMEPNMAEKLLARMID